MTFAMSPGDTNAWALATATNARGGWRSRESGSLAAGCNANVVSLGQVQVSTPSRLAGVPLPDTFTGHLADDLRRISTTPRFGWISPNLCNDGHDTTCAGPNAIGQTGAGAGGLHGADEFLAHWIPLLQASPAYRSGSMLIVVTFDEAGPGGATACCGETPGPENPTPGFSSLLAPIYRQYGLPIPDPAPGGGRVGAVAASSALHHGRKPPASMW
jgi:phosphatidylinositol-3-phosphatase